MNCISPLQPITQANMYVYVTGLAPMQLQSPLQMPSSPAQAVLGPTVAASCFHAPKKGRVAQRVPAERFSAAKPSTKNTPSSSPAFVWEGWKYPAGLNRKERRAIMFPQDKRHVSNKVIGRVWAGADFPQGPISDEKSNELNQSAIEDPSLADPSPWSPLIHIVTPSGTDDASSCTGTPLTPSELDGSYDGLDFDLPPLIDEDTDEDA